MIENLRTSLCLFCSLSFNFSILYSRATLGDHKNLSQQAKKSYELHSCVKPMQFCIRAAKY